MSSTISNTVKTCHADLLGSESQVVDILAEICRGFEDIDAGVKQASAELLHSVLLQMDKEDTLLNCKAIVKDALEKLLPAILQILLLPNLAAVKVTALKCFYVIISSFYKENTTFLQSIKDYIKILPVIIIRKIEYFDVAIKAVDVLSLICRNNKIVALSRNCSIILNCGETLRLILRVIVEGDQEGVELFHDLKSACGNCIIDILKLRIVATRRDTSRNILMDFIIEKTRPCVIDTAEKLPWQDREAGVYVLSLLLKSPEQEEWVLILVKRLLLNDDWAYELNTNVYLRRTTLTMISATLEAFHHPGDGETPIDRSNANSILTVLVENTEDGDEHTALASVRSICLLLQGYMPLKKPLARIYLQTLEIVRKQLAYVTEMFSITDENSDAVQASNLCDHFIEVLKSG